MTQIEDTPKFDFDDVLIRPKRSTLASRADVEVERTFIFPHNSHTWTGFPLVASNMDTVGTFSMAQSLQNNHMLTCLHKYYTLEDWLQQGNQLQAAHIAVTIGSSQTDFEHLQAIAMQRPLQWICLDVANGYTESFVEAVKRTRAAFRNAIIIAGNVVTREMTEALIIAGADVVKVGIGSGSACLTRRIAGVGYPQLSAILECADAAHGLGGHLMSDGGCRTPGDVAKAFAAGADFVMLGGMLAGHAESGGELITKNGQPFKEF